MRHHKQEKKDNDKDGSCDKSRDRFVSICERPFADLPEITC